MTANVAPSKRGSHAPSLRTLARRTIVEDHLFERGQTVLCACSGGPDSTALLDVLCTLRVSLGFSLVAHGVDHGLRPEAPAELDHARAVASAHGVPFEVTRVEVARGGNLQERARDARLRALSDAAMRLGASAIATGHTADDRAETFLLRLLRGSGPRGLAVLPPKAPLPFEGAPPVTLVRPLLRARRDAVLLHLERRAIAAASDPSNEDPRYARVRVRHEVLPLLAELSPKIVENLCELAEILMREPAATEPLAAFGGAQQRAIERARRLGRASIQIRVRGGEDVDVTFPSGGPVLIEGR